MMSKLTFAVIVATLFTLAMAVPASAVADDNASCIGIGASTVATGAAPAPFTDIPTVLAIIREDLGTQGIGAFASDSAQQHLSSFAACFPPMP